MRSLALLAAAGIVMAGCAAQAGAESEGGKTVEIGKTTFEVLGIGGAGGMFTPAVSPDGSVMLISCDMSGSYRSLDGGKTWEMIHWREVSGSRGCRPCFSPDGAIYWIAGRTLKVSRDKAKTWQPAVKGEAPWGKGGVTQIAADAKAVYVGTAAGIWRKPADGQWKKVVEGKCGPLVAVGGSVFAVAGGGLTISTDGGANWSKATVTGAEGKPIAALAAGKGEGGKVLFAGVPALGVAKSTDGGKTWKLLAGSPKAGDILMATNQADVAYAIDAGRAKKVWRTADGGKTWSSCFRMGGGNGNVERSWVQTELKWGYYITQYGLGVHPGNPDVALVSTQGDFYITRNGGKSWLQLMNIGVGPAEGDPGYRYKCNGLEVTSCWEYLFDPFDKDKHYIAYTDIGFCRSLDRGKTWISATKGSPWRNTYYKVICDPKTKGRLYAAAANRHDIPHWTHVDSNKGRHAVGGVIVSDDFGKRWRVLGTGLPKLPCTYLAMDPKTADKPDGERIFYCTLYEGGVYKSTDGGRTWKKKSKGLGNPGNMHCFMIQVHPKTGDIYCSITAHRHGSKFPVAGGLWKSTDGAETWVDVSKSAKLYWPAAFLVHPEKPEVMYLSAATIPGGRQGGIYKTTDGGATWKRILKDEDFAATGGAGYVHCLFLNFHPDDPDRIYAGTSGHGLWRTKDAGKTWKRFEGIPFKPCQNVAFDPDDRTIMYVTTFGGGVWKGPYEP